MVMRGEFSRKGILLGFNPVVIAVFVTVGITLTGLDSAVPVFATSAFAMVGATAIPIALLVTGALIYDYLEPKDFLKNPKFGIAACVMRLALLPVVFLFVANSLPFNLELKQVIIVQAAMPCAVLPVVLSKRYGGKMTVSVQVVVATALVSILTIPLWIQIGQRVLLP